MRRIAVAALLTVLPVAANAMTVAEFLTRAEALKAKGMMAMMSSDLPVIRGEMQAATTAYRADVDAARAKGRKDLGCPPPKGQAKLSSDIVMADLAALPKAVQARTTVKAALYDLMRKRYPCK
ncbi:hypothetical protein [Sphingomonas sp. SUN039]|uniref:hypothetical protein n=1 Tax=Sphingomonas sp. SUN039 TaxID=2937787 RepID=UPI0021644AEC|nr:hypothetical protein [Sphingomonas sp. SUN039]UVO55349.1 hypothetical protein M0209_14895 [Sphingomonas sp. SUN039]